MHVDLNSCFATIEQQANPLLRGKPMVVAAYDTPNGCVVAPSISDAFDRLDADGEGWISRDAFTAAQR